MKALGTLEEAVAAKVDELARAGRGVTVRLCPGARSLLSLGHWAYLRMALCPVLDNAFEAVRDQERSEIVIEAVEHEAVLRVTVSDTGPGIPSDVLPHILEPFVTTKPGHAGMGLSICWAALQAVGGSVSIASSDAMGSRVVVEVPLTDGQTVDADGQR